MGKQQPCQYPLFCRAFQNKKLELVKAACICGVFSVFTMLGGSYMCNGYIVYIVEFYSVYSASINYKLNFHFLL